MDGRKAAILDADPPGTGVAGSRPSAVPAASPFHERPSPSKPPPLPERVFDFHLATLDAAQQAELRQRLARLPGPLAQQVLDEYNSAVGRQVPFRNRWGWIEYLIRAALEGRFIPTSDLPERRPARATAAAVPPPRVPSPV